MIKVLQIIFTLMAIVCIVAGIAILMGHLDAAALINVPPTFNQPCSIILIITGLGVLTAPYLTKHRN